MKIQCKGLQSLLLNSLLCLWVPAAVWSAFEAPETDPIPFALANLSSFPDYLVSDSAATQRWILQTAGGRLFGLPELQPFSVRLSGPGWRGRCQIRASGLKYGAYSETLGALQYESAFVKSMRVSVELCALQVAIKDYGTTWSYQVNARWRWQATPRADLVLGCTNVTGSRFGEGKYPLPTRLTLGAKLELLPRLQSFCEIEKESRYPLTSRIGVGFQPLPPVAILAALQTDPGIVAFGLSSQIKRFRATAAYQFHPELGFSQCYGLVVRF